LIVIVHGRLRIAGIIRITYVIARGGELTIRTDGDAQLVVVEFRASVGQATGTVAVGGVSTGGARLLLEVDWREVTRVHIDAGSGAKDGILARVAWAPNGGAGGAYRARRARLALHRALTGRDILGIRAEDDGISLIGGRRTRLTRVTELASR
jgi:hypothetical protein